MLPKWKVQIIDGINRKVAQGATLTFVHTPKTAGTYTAQYLSLCNIKNISHRQSHDTAASFTILRDPVKRFESYLNYRLSFKHPKKDFPERLRYVHYDKTIQLNEIVQKLHLQDIRKFTPFNTLKFWSKNVNLLITIDELEDTLSLLGFANKLKGVKFERKNVSPKKRGTLSKEMVAKVSRFYLEDIALFNYWTRTYPPWNENQQSPLQWCEPRLS